MTLPDVSRFCGVCLTDSEEREVNDDIGTLNVAFMLNLASAVAAMNNARRTRSQSVNGALTSSEM